MIRWICLALIFGCGGTQVGSAVAQDSEDTSSRRENSVIAAVETAGGKVFKISAAGPEREISFNLSGQPIRDEHLKELNAIQNVIWLNLAGTEISNAGLQNLAGMPLKKLHLERTQVGDEGMAAVAKLSELEYLNLYGTKVTDAGLEQLKGLKNLKKIYLWQSAATAEGMQKLRDVLPDCQVVGEVKLVVPVVEEPKKEEPKKEEPKKEEPKKESESGKTEATEKGDG